MQATQFDETKMLKITKSDIKGADLMLYYGYDKFMNSLAPGGVASLLVSPNYI